jgi:hypothetical protein
MIDYEDRGMDLLVDTDLLEGREVWCPVRDEYGIADVVTATRGRQALPRCFECPICGAEHEIEVDGYEG